MSLQETLAPFQITKERKVALPLALLIGIIAAIAISYARLIAAEDNGKRNTTDITEIKRDAQTQREILIRIDENVKDLRRDIRRSSSP